MTPHQKQTKQIHFFKSYHKISLHSNPKKTNLNTQNLIQVSLDIKQYHQLINLCIFSNILLSLNLH